MEQEQMPKVDLSKDALRLTVSDLYHMKKIQEENIKRVERLKKIRFRNRWTGSFLGLFALGVYSYTIYAVKQETFLDDFEVPETVSDER